MRRFLFRRRFLGAGLEKYKIQLQTGLQAFEALVGIEREFVESMQGLYDLFLMPLVPHVKQLDYVNLDRKTESGTFAVFVHLFPEFVEATAQLISNGEEGVKRLVSSSVETEGGGHNHSEYVKLTGEHMQAVCTHRQSIEKWLVRSMTVMTVMMFTCPSEMDTAVQTQTNVLWQWSSKRKTRKSLNGFFNLTLQHQINRTARLDDIIKFTEETHFQVRELQKGRSRMEFAKNSLKQTSANFGSLLAIEKAITSKYHWSKDWITDNMEVFRALHTVAVGQQQLVSVFLILLFPVTSKRGTRLPARPDSG